MPGIATPSRRLENPDSSAPVRRRVRGRVRERGRRRSGRAALATAILAVLLAGPVVAITATPAAAHDVLISTSPKDGQSLDTPPSQIELTFDQPALAVGTTMVVVGPSGQVQRGRPVLVNATVSQDLDPGLAAGGYTVTWRVTSADGHPVSGTFSFTVRSTGTTTPAAVGTGQGVTSTGTTSTAPAPAATTGAPTPSSDAATDEGGRGWVPWVAAALLAVAAAGAALATVVRVRRGAGRP